jgi:hypothetical protein
MADYSGRKRVAMMAVKKVMCLAAATDLSKAVYLVDNSVA